MEFGQARLRLPDDPSMQLKGKDLEGKTGRQGREEEQHVCFPKVEGRAKGLAPALTRPDPT